VANVLGYEIKNIGNQNQRHQNKKFQYKKGSNQQWRDNLPKGKNIWKSQKIHFHIFKGYAHQNLGKMKINLENKLLNLILIHEKTLKTQSVF
jgi:hypothetical protein